MKFCSNPKCKWHVDVSPTVEKCGRIVEELDDKLIEIQCHPYRILNENKIFFCDICKGAIDTVNRQI